MRARPFADPLLADLAARTARAVADAVPRGQAIALVNFPNHRNAGDPALWLGGLLALRRAGAEVRYVCDPEAYDPAELRRRLGDHPLVAIGGGGNFGDRYLRQQDARERVLQDFPGGRFVQLPQSIEFLTDEARDRNAALFAERDVVLMVREQQSVDRARRMGLDPVLVPDAALQLGPLERPVGARVDVLWQHRSDAEQVRDGLDPTALLPDGVTVEVRDWLGDLGADEEPRRPTERLAAAAERRAAAALEDGRHTRRAPDVLRLAYPRLAAHWTRRGTHLLGLGRTVVTDRLHGHLLSLASGRPHVALDNATGKVHQTTQLWTGEHELVRVADDPAHAAELATALLASGVQ